MPLEGVQAILATSANGVRALARRTPRRDVPLFAVGPQTAGEAHAMGFQNVKSADGDAAALAQCTLRWAKPDQGALLHVVGAGNDGKLAGALAGFTLRQEILYAVTAVEKMPAEAALALQEGALDAALFFSPRSAACVPRLRDAPRICPCKVCSPPVSAPPRRRLWRRSPSAGSALPPGPTWLLCWNCWIEGQFHGHGPCFFAIRPHSVIKALPFIGTFPPAVRTRSGRIIRGYFDARSDRRRRGPDHDCNGCFRRKRR